MYLAAWGATPVNEKTIDESYSIPFHIRALVEEPVAKANNKKPVR